MEKTRENLTSKSTISGVITTADFGVVSAKQVTLRQREVSTHELKEIGMLAITLGTAGTSRSGWKWEASYQIGTMPPIGYISWIALTLLSVRFFRMG